MLKKDYFDTLTEVAEIATLLKSLPIPSDETGQVRNLERLVTVRALLHAMLRQIQPGVDLWAGEPNDPLRNGRPLAKDWDRLVG